MIISNLIKLKFTNDIAKIEKELKNFCVEPLRWAIVEVSENELTLCVSYEQK